MKIYIETWEDRNGLRLDIAFTQYEMEKCLSNTDVPSVMLYPKNTVLT